MRPSQVTQFLLAVLPTQVETEIVPFLWGPPGVGKSAIVRQVAKTLGANLIDIRLSEHDASEIKGLDMPHPKDKQLVRYLPEFCSRLKEGKTILFFDEANSGHPSTQPPLYKITNDRHIGDFKIPDDTMIVLAGNREEDRAITHRMSSALGNRLAHIQFEISQDDLVAWAIKSGIKQEMRAFWRFRPSLIHSYNPDSKAWPSPRSWTRAEKIIHSSLNHDTEFEALKGIVGEGPAGEFMAFLNHYRDLPSVEDVIKNPTTLPVSKEVGVQYAITTALASAATKKNIGAMLKYVERMPTEFQVIFLRDAVATGSGIDDTAEFNNWAVKNASVLSV